MLQCRWLWLAGRTMQTRAVLFDSLLCSRFWCAERQEEEWDRKTVTRTIDEQDEATAALIAEATKVRGGTCSCTSVWVSTLTSRTCDGEGANQSVSRPFCFC